MATLGKTWNLTSGALKRVGRARLGLDAAETKAKLDADIQSALPFDPRGTPVVVLNGRATQASGPFLYAMILAGGDANHPAFAHLPKPKRNGPGTPGHEGHAH